MILYHGTRKPFTKNGYLFPQSFHGEQARPGNHATEYAYATTDYELAIWYALNTPGRGKPKVLTLLPIGPVEPDPSPFDNEQDQYRTKIGFKVVKVTML